MSSEVTHQIRQTVEDEVKSRPSAFEFEMAYQARTAIDRIKFAIKHTEQFGSRTDEMFEASVQLLDAVERLELLDRRFQERSRLGSWPSQTRAGRDKRTENGRKISFPRQPVNRSGGDGQGIQTEQSDNPRDMRFS
jgi:hypothetical protein